MNRRELLLTGSMGGALIFTGQISLAQWLPDRPVTIIVPFNAGGGNDSFARALAPGLEAELGQPVVISNRPGSGGLIGATEAAGMKPDGTTLLLSSGGAFVLNAMLRDSPVNPFDDFEILGQVGSLSTAIVVPAESPFRTTGDLVEYASAHPGELRWGHTGRGTVHHVAGQTLLDANGIEAVDVPFKDGAGVRAAALGGQVDFVAIGAQQALGFENDLRVLGLISDERDAVQTEIPTMKEQGIPYTVILSPITIFAPAGIDPEVATSIEAALKNVVESPEYAEMLKRSGNSPKYRSGPEVKALLKEIEDNARPLIEIMRQ